MTDPRQCPICQVPLTPGEPDGPCRACTAAAAASGQATIRAAPRPAAPAPQELSGLFPQLDVTDLLGRGGMGCVYRARQRELDRPVALKLLPPEIQSDPGFAERFAREGRALARLSHPAIVTVHDSGQIDGLYYFIMEFIDGLNLRQLLHRGGGRLEAAEALRIVGEVCDALDYAHGEGVVHRDIKPENILLDRRGRVKIADFGLAKLVGGDAGGGTRLNLTAPMQVIGTPHYMAPEQTERPTEVDHRADIYALGVVLYEMMTGELPLGRFPLPSEMGRGDARLDQLVLRALDKSPQRRFQRASEIGTAVRSLLSGAAPMPAAPGSPMGSSMTLTPAGPVSSLHVQVDFVEAYERVRRSANWLFLAGVLSLVLYLPPAIVMGILEVTGAGGDVPQTALLLSFTAASFCAVVVMFGSQRMKRLERRPLAVVASMLAILPTSPACWLWMTLPVGLWALTTLNRREIVAAFELKAAEKRASRKRR